MSNRNGQVPAALQTAVDDFTEWRATRKKRTIPEELWKRAARLGLEYGPTRTARLLRLDYGRLKERMERLSTPPESRPEFVELRLEGPPGPVAAAGPAEISDRSECIVELETPTVSRLRLELRGEAALTGAVRLAGIVRDTLS